MLIIRSNDRLDGLVKQAKKDCLHHDIYEGVNQLGISGGKDSTALRLLAYELEVPRQVPTFCDTENENEKTVNYVQYLSDTLQNLGSPPIQTIKQKQLTEEDFAKKRERLRAAWSKPHKIRNGKEKGKFIPPMTERQIQEACDMLKPSGNRFLDMCLMHGMFPIRKTQFCTLEAKLNPLYDDVIFPLLENQDREIFSWSGVRRDESKKRADALLIEEDKRDKEGFLLNFRPLVDWTAEDVFAMHKRHNIEPNPLYKEGMNRVGCMPCINCNKEEVHQIDLRYPETFDRIEEWERIVTKVSRWAIYRGITLSFLGGGQKSTTKNLTVRDHVEWSKTTRGGKSFDLIKQIEDPNACSSQYGLCE
jgi:3'-phosphoadenosine 5'-phosphosulfate sulfotransferase (PAPS reductase)/FAD synthetase